MTGKDIAFLLVGVIIIAAVAIMGISLANYEARFPPIDGRVSSKYVYQGYYPAFPDSPVVFVLVITSHDGRQGYSWQVDEETYKIYSVGDIVERGKLKLPEVTHE